MTAKGKYTLHIQRGDDWDLPITMTSKKTGPINITSYEFYFILKKYETDTDDQALYKKTVVAPHTSPLIGKTVISIPIADNEKFLDGTFFFSLRYKDSANKLKTLMKGTCIIN